MTKQTKSRNSLKTHQGSHLLDSIPIEKTFQGIKEASLFLKTNRKMLSTIFLTITISKKKKKFNKINLDLIETKKS